MPSCTTIDPLITPYVDGELSAAERTQIDDHLSGCPPCRSRVAAEQAVRDLLHDRKSGVCSERAPAGLRSQCALLAGRSRSVEPTADRTGASPVARARRAVWRERLAPLAAAAVLILIVGGAFLYQATRVSSRVMAAELAADHMKCFAMNALLGTRHSEATVQSSMASGFGWKVQLPADARSEELELVGSRPCLYGEGKVAHIMYRHRGRPLSLFMLPRTARSEEIVEAFGQQCAIWSDADRTFVLVGREDRSDIQRLAAYMHAALR